MIRLVLPYPVSGNRYWRIARNRLYRSKEAMEYRREVALIACKRGYIEPLAGGVIVRMALCPKLTKRGLASETRLDLDNCLKVALDALQGVAFENDKQIVKIVAEIGPAQVGGALMVEIEGA